MGVGDTPDLVENRSPTRSDARGTPGLTTQLHSQNAHRCDRRRYCLFRAALGRRRSDGDAHAVRDDGPGQLCIPGQGQVLANPGNKGPCKRFSTRAAFESLTIACARPTPSLQDWDKTVPFWKRADWVEKQAAADAANAAAKPARETISRFGSTYEKGAWEGDRKR